MSYRVHLIMNAPRSEFCDYEGAARPPPKYLRPSYAPSKPSRLRKTWNHDDIEIPAPVDYDSDSDWSYKSIANLSSVTDRSDGPATHRPVLSQSPHLAPSPLAEAFSLENVSGSFYESWEEFDRAELASFVPPPPGFTENDRGRSGFRFDDQDILEAEDLLFQMDHPRFFGPTWHEGAADAGADASEGSTSSDDSITDDGFDDDANETGDDTNTTDNGTLKKKKKVRGIRLARRYKTYNGSYATASSGTKTAPRKWFEFILKKVGLLT